MPNIPEFENKCQRGWLKLAHIDCLTLSLQRQQARLTA